MPEEINRIVADHLSDLLLCPSKTSIENLAAEGITRGVHLVGDVMADAMLYVAERTRDMSRVLAQLELRKGKYLLATVHRAENSDDRIRLLNILTAFNMLEETVVFPVHPRTRRAIEALGYIPSENVHLINPVGHLDMVMLEQSARMILTDSGGVQKEAYWLGIPCLTMRLETEWVETVDAGWNVLVGTDTDQILHAINTFVPPSVRPALYGNGDAAMRIAEILSSLS
jgi:UDP-N-acetylglucosamine 2-epimerase